MGAGYPHPVGQVEEPRVGPPRWFPSPGDTGCSVGSRGGAVAGLGPCKQVAFCRAQPRRWFRFLGALPRVGVGGTNTALPNLVWQQPHGCLGRWWDVTLTL